MPTSASSALLVTLVSLLLLSPVSRAEDPKGIVHRTDIFERHADGYHTYRIPTMVVTDRGTVLLFCEGRKKSRRDHGDVDLLLKRSEDGGRTWSQQVLIHEEGGEAPIRVGNPCPIVERDGKTVHVLFTRGGGGKGDCFFATTSKDDGKTWSPFQTASDNPTAKEYTKDSFLTEFGGTKVHVGAGPVHGIQTKSGRLIAPSYVGQTVDGKGQGGSCTIYSDDNGKTWKAGGIIPSVPEFGHGECTILERSDGSLLMNMRIGPPNAYSFGYRAISESKDGGLTWSKPVVDKNLPCPACQGSILRLNDKEVLFLNPNVNYSGGFAIWSRRNLTLRLSKDDGKSWAAARILNKKLAGYSDIAVAKNGNILCVFENGVKDYCEKISIMEVTREWLLAGKEFTEKKEEK